eukprot:5155511-Ditylum_brightwellii.AAC.1
MSSLACLVHPGGFSGTYWRFLLAVVLPHYPPMSLLQAGSSYVHHHSCALMAHSGIESNAPQKRLTGQIVSSLACLVHPGGLS